MPVSGSKWSPNAMKVKYGPSWRYIVDLKEDSIKALGIYPGGQSGNPGNINYFGEIENWGKGTYRKLLFNKSFIDNKNKIIFEKTYYKE